MYVPCDARKLMSGISWPIGLWVMSIKEKSNVEGYHNLNNV